MQSSLQESFLTPWLKNAHMATSWKQRLHLPASQGEPPSHRWCLGLQAALVANTDTTPPGGESWDYGERWDKQAVSQLENLHLQMIHLVDALIQSRDDKQKIICAPRLRLWQGQSDICSCYNDLKKNPDNINTLGHHIYKNKSRPASFLGHYLPSVKNVSNSNDNTTICVKIHSLIKSFVLVSTAAQSNTSVCIDTALLLCQHVC